MEETELIQHARQGDQNAFASLMELHGRFVFNLALRAVSDPQEAEDVAQEAFLRAWQALPSFRQQARFRTWMYRIVLNLCLNRFPRFKRELSQLSEDELDLAPPPALDTFLFDPAARLERKELISHLHQEMDRLPERYSVLISLRYHDELSYDEIALLLGLPLTAVKTGLFRAKERLREALSIYQEEPV